LENNIANAFVSLPTVALLAGLCIGLSAPPAHGADLLVGNFVSGDESVKRYNTITGTFVDNFVPNGSGGLSFPLGGAFGPDGNLYVSNSDGDNILRYNGKTGASLGTFVSSGSGGLQDPAGLGTPARGDLLVGRIVRAISS
jgi:hypothetical protein